MRIQNLDELMRTQFAAVQTQFANIDIRFAEKEAQLIIAKRDAEKAIEVAHAAQKEVERIQNASNMTTMHQAEKTTMRQLDAIKSVSPRNSVLVERDLAAIKDKVDGMNGQDNTMAMAALTLASIAVVLAGLRWVL